MISYRKGQLVGLCCSSRVYRGVFGSPEYEPPARRIGGRCSGWTTLKVWRDPGTGHAGRPGDRSRPCFQSCLATDMERWWANGALPSLLTRAKKSQARRSRRQNSDLAGGAHPPRTGGHYDRAEKQQGTSTPAKFSHTAIRRSLR